MAISINSYLKDLSYSFYLKNDSTEVKGIVSSLDNLISNLDKELGVLIKRIIVFGSYDRDTILPRTIDAHSDIDLMVVFNTSDHERTPGTYRIRLKRFADKYYKNRYGSEVVKTFPTITIRLDRIKYDLVPAKEESFFFSTSLYIPSKGGGWQITDPDDVKKKLVEVNSRYNSIVRPIIRLMKAWNCKSSYPFDSYELELLITNMYFSGYDIQSGFFYAVSQLYHSYADSQLKKYKINSLKYNIKKVKEALNLDDVPKAKLWLRRVLPTG